MPDLFISKTNITLSLYEHEKKAFSGYPLYIGFSFNMALLETGRITKQNMLVKFQQLSKVYLDFINSLIELDWSCTLCIMKLDKYISLSSPLLLIIKTPKALK